MRVTELRAFFLAGSPGAALICSAVERLGLSARAYHRILRVPRPIVALHDREPITANDLLEAVDCQPRGRDR